jgi:hypothetical protein
LMFGAAFLKGISAMRPNLGVLGLAPSGVVVECVSSVGGTIVVCARAAAADASSRLKCRSRVGMLRRAQTSCRDSGEAPHVRPGHLKAPDRKREPEENPCILRGAHA